MTACLFWTAMSSAASSALPDAAHSLHLYLRIPKAGSGQVRAREYIDGKVRVFKNIRWRAHLHVAACAASPKRRETERFGSEMTAAGFIDLRERVLYPSERRVSFPGSRSRRCLPTMTALYGSARKMEVWRTYETDIYSESFRRRDFQVVALFPSLMISREICGLDRIAAFSVFRGRI